MSEKLNGREEATADAVTSESGRRVFGGEPFHRTAVEGVSTPAMSYISEGRGIIKNQSSAPHLGIVMPIGDKDEMIVSVDEDNEKKVVGHYRQPGLVPIELMINAQQVMQPLNITLSWFTMKNDLSARLREQMTEQALERGVSYIFYWDDDVLIPHNAWYRMLNFMNRFPDIGIISGVYYTKVVPTEPIIYKDSGEGAYWGFNQSQDSIPEDIYAAGAGCLMVRADVLRRMERPWWNDERSADEEGTWQGIVGHDIRFCRNMRKETGYRVTVDGSIQCHHFDIQNQRVYHAPKQMPSMKDAREISDGYVNLDEKTEPDSLEEIEAATQPAKETVTV